MTWLIYPNCGPALWELSIATKNGSCHLPAEIQWEVREKQNRRAGREREVLWKRAGLHCHSCALQGTLEESLTNPGALVFTDRRKQRPAGQLTAVPSCLQASPSQATSSGQEETVGHRGVFSIYLYLLLLRESLLDVRGQ